MITKPSTIERAFIALTSQREYDYILPHITPDDEAQADEYIKKYGETEKAYSMIVSIFDYLAMEGLNIN